MKRNQIVHVALVQRTEALMIMLARARLPRPVRLLVESHVSSDEVRGER